MMRAADVSGLPPAYVATSGFDPLRDEGEIYAARMREAGVQVVLQRHPGQIHGFANLTAICPSARTAMLEAAGALRMGLGLAAAPAAVSSRLIPLGGMPYSGATRSPPMGGKKLHRHG